MKKYEILDYLRQHLESDNTVKLLCEKLNLTKSQALYALDNLEYMKLVRREAKMIVQGDGIERKTFVYSAVC